MGGVIVRAILLAAPAVFLAGCAAGRADRAPSAPSAVHAIARFKAETLPEFPMMLQTRGEEPIARMPGLNISREQFLAPLIEGHGLTVLLNVAQLELAKQNASRRGLALTEDDLRQERQRTLQQAFGEMDAKIQQQVDAAVARNDQAAAEKLRAQLKIDHEQMLQQLLAQQRVTRPEFEIVLRTNAYLRKIAESEIKEISDDLLRKRFETEYGATVRVRHIQGGNVAELQAARTRLNAGEPFEKVAREASRNARTGALGGELPRFGLATTNIPDNFKEAAFALKEGDVSEIVECEGVYHLIKLEQKFAPRAVKFENVKESLREKVREQLVQGIVLKFRDDLAQQAREHLKIEDPVMNEQFARRLQERDKQIRDLEKIKQQQERDRQLLQPAPGQAPSTPQDPPAAPAPAPQPEPAAAPKPAEGR
jgi:parvulin-like peptidyl-prolyl isomerase